ncbi:MAG: amino acid ABC transporter permease [Pseudomonadota bacterium]
MLRKKTKFGTLDIIILLLFFSALAYVVYRGKSELHYQWNWAAIFQYILRYDAESGKWVPNLLLQGLFTTIRLSLWGTVLATVLGTAMGLCRVSRSLFKRLIGRTYVELIRNLPPLVLIFIFYFFIGDQIMAYVGVDEMIKSATDRTLAFIDFFFAPPPLFPAFLSALVTLALFEGAYIAEIVRAGIQSIEKGQWEASWALGLTRWQQMRYIILPQAVQRTLPPMAGQFISTIKDSAIVSVISIQELTFQGMEIMSATYLTFEIWITVTALYLLLTLALSLGVERFERVMQRSSA